MYKKIINKKEIGDALVEALIATALFIIIPTSFLLILYVKTASQQD